MGERIEDVNGRDMMGLLGQSRIEMSLCFVIYDDLCVVGTLSYHWHIPYWHKELGKKLS